MKSIQQMEEGNEEVLSNKLHVLAKALTNWLTINRDALMEQVIVHILNEFRTQPSPQIIEGIETGLDFLGLLKTEGGDNGLYEFTMELLDREIYNIVANLDESEQIVLLLPMLSDEIDDLVRDRNINEWAQCLLHIDSSDWQTEIRDAILDRIESRSRYDANLS